MELRQLEYYVAVVQHGSILQAASALNLSQPPLSVAMKQLEQELGTPLFFRGARRIQLTAAGERFYSAGPGHSQPDGRHAPGDHRLCPGTGGRPAPGRGLLLCRFLIISKTFPFRCTASENAISDRRRQYV